MEVKKLKKEAKIDYKPLKKSVFGKSSKSPKIEFFLPVSKIDSITYITAFDISRINPLRLALTQVVARMMQKLLLKFFTSKPRIDLASKYLVDVELISDRIVLRILIFSLRPNLLKKVESAVEHFLSDFTTKLGQIDDKMLGLLQQEAYLAMDDGFWSLRERAADDENSLYRTSGRIYDLTSDAVATLKDKEIDLDLFGLFLERTFLRSKRVIFEYFELNQGLKDKERRAIYGARYGGLGNVYQNRQIEPKKA